MLCEIESHFEMLASCSVHGCDSHLFLLQHHMSCLTWAAGRGYTEVVRLLLEHEAKVNTADKVCEVIASSAGPKEVSWSFQPCHLWMNALSVVRLSPFDRLKLALGSVSKGPLQKIWSVLKCRYYAVQQ